MPKTKKDPVAIAAVREKANKLEKKLKPLKEGPDAEGVKLRLAEIKIQIDELCKEQKDLKARLDTLEQVEELTREYLDQIRWLKDHDPDFCDDLDDDDWGDDDDEDQDPDQPLPAEDDDEDPRDGAARAESPNTRKLEAAVSKAPGGPDTKGWVFRMSLGARKQADDVARALTLVAVRKKPKKGPAKLYALKAPLMGDVTRPTPSVLHIQSSSSSLDTLKEIVAALPKLLSGVKYGIQDARIMPAECPDCKSSRFLIDNPEFCRRHITPTPGCQAYVQQQPPKKRKR
ncbi:MAG: hypothetical protein GWO44_22255 [Thermoplasmata archaeon]|nr:hypothetical protein [Thermoplasmata archaeon]NIY05906.1 hypothetical protein [Thermoplasmata archaeon]